MKDLAYYDRSTETDMNFCLLSTVVTYVNTYIHAVFVEILMVVNIKFRQFTIKFRYVGVTEHVHFMSKQ